MITSGFITSPGGRSGNEDAACVLEQGGCRLFCLADGLGGHGLGGEASGLAVETAGALFAANPANSGLPEAVIQAVHQALRRAQAESRQKHTRMTTLVCAHLGGGALTWAHVGDSRLYLFQAGRLITRTRDHSVPEMLVRWREITEDEIRSHPDRNRILKAAGMDSDKLEADTGAAVFSPGMSLLLCSDGFWEPVTEEAMLAALEQADTVQDWLGEMEAGLRRGLTTGSDNYTAIGVWNR